MLEGAHQIPVDSEFDCLKGCHFLSVIPPCKGKENHKSDVLSVTKAKLGKNLVIIAKPVKIIQDCALRHVS